MRPRGGLSNFAAAKRVNCQAALPVLCLPVLFTTWYSTVATLHGLILLPSFHQNSLHQNSKSEIPLLDLRARSRRFFVLLASTNVGRALL